ncbi:MAG: imidazoleglycerol-phosphate dehydratase HisB [Elusimicrobia bacterium]|nr:imidazoleglycerol-phosphate dehydratase HisB [Elusimicrobiota bacterium]
MKNRLAVVKRDTKETKIEVKLNIDGQGDYQIETGIPFLNHMLELFAKHGLFDLKIKAKGDLEVDIHHTNEDVGICLGQAFDRALGDRKGIKRFGEASVPMDEALAWMSLDINGRPALYSTSDKRIKLPGRDKKGYSFEDAKHFLRSFCQPAGINAHINILAGEDLHHILEAVFKALARALDTATKVDPRIKGIPSTKGRI